MENTAMKGEQSWFLFDVPVESFKDITGITDITVWLLCHQIPLKDPQGQWEKVKNDWGQFPFYCFFLL